MRRFKNLSLQEKLLLLSAVLLLTGLLFKWPKVKEGFISTCEKLGIVKSDDSEE